MMNEKKGASLLAFLNVLSSELGLEDFRDLKEAQQIVPILVDYVNTGQLKFVDTHAFNFHAAIVEIEKKLSEHISSSLNLESAEKGNIVELAKLFLMLIFSLRISYNSEFDFVLEHLSADHNYILTDMLNSLENQRDSSSPLSIVLCSQIENGKNLNNTRKNLQIFSTAQDSPSPSKQALAEEETSKYKIKATELETRLKQVETLNTSLNEQLGVTQNEYSELEHKFESLKSTQARKQETIQELQIQLKEAIDESELMRYENSQLQRELKNVNERHAKLTEKLTQEVKAKESEMNLLYRRLDDYVKQLAAKESLENRVKFLDQQMNNHQGIQRELREDMEKALNRANLAETELATLRKQMKNFANNSMVASKDNIQKGSIGDACEVSLHDELNSTLSHSLSAMEYNGLDASSKSVDSAANAADDELVHLRTRLEMLDSENKHLKKAIADGKKEMDSIRNSESQCAMDKALEIERLKQECEILREELHKLRQKEIVSREKCKKVEDENESLQIRANKLEDSLDKAASVIEEYSTATEKHCSAAELLQIRHELTRAQGENQLLLNKMDQFKHEATQEQRLITTHWYNAHIELLKTRHGLGSKTFPASSVDNNGPSVQRISQQPSPSFTDDTNSISMTTKTAKSFLRRQIETSTTFPPRWWTFLIYLFLTLMGFFWYTGLSVDLNYDYYE